MCLPAIVFNRVNNSGRSDAKNMAYDVVIELSKDGGDGEHKED